MRGPRRSDPSMNGKWHQPSAPASHRLEEQSQDTRSHPKPACLPRAPTADKHLRAGHGAELTLEAVNEH